MDFYTDGYFSFNRLQNNKALKHFNQDEDAESSFNRLQNNKALKPAARE